MKKFYLIGIKGAGVSALALMLNDLGYDVVGYDDTKSYEFTEEKLIQRGIKYYYDNTHILDENTIVVRSSAIKDTHPEIIRATELNLEIYDLFEYIGKITEDYETISIAGCHGKTTTSAMLTSVMDKELGVNYYIGDGRGKLAKENKIMIAEACEYRHHFMHYDTDYTLITNIDNDHLDYFKDLEDIKNTFLKFANKTKKKIIACGDDENIRDLTFTVPTIYYGIKENNDVIAKNINYTETGMNFDVYINDELFANFSLPFFGEHNLLNSLSVITICNLYNISATKINEILQGFKGAARRFAETKLNNNIVVDDYAHHSTEVMATVKTARHKYPTKKIVAIFEPHSFKRVIDLHKEFSEALNQADYSYVLPINPSRDNIADYPSITNEMILKNLKNGEEIKLNEVAKLLQYENAVFLFMSLKEIHELKDNLIERLKVN